jgi:hypothetical protein
MALLYGCAGRSTAHNGGFRRGQTEGNYGRTGKKGRSWQRDKEEVKKKGKEAKARLLNPERVAEGKRAEEERRAGEETQEAPAAGAGVLSLGPGPPGADTRP